MAAVLFGMIVVAGAGVAVAANLAAYAQRHWTGRADVVGTVRLRTARPLGDVAGFGEQLRPAAERYGYVGARRGR